MIKANVILDYSKWKNKIKDPNNYLNKKLRKLSKIPTFKKKKQEFSILLTNNTKMKNLNLKFRKKNKPTDILSFKSNNNIYIGDIAISYEIINKRSKLSNFFLEFDKMWIHGYFHLIGYDHKKLEDFKKMNKKENLVLNYFHKIN
jgi:probable rRNA maturation factor